MFSSEELPEVPTHSHSFRFYTLLGAPLAKLAIPSTFGGFHAPTVEVHMHSLKVVS